MSEFLLVTDVCQNPDFLKVMLFAKRILQIVYYLVPILLIVFVSLDFFKNVIASKEDDMAKNTSLVFKRLISAVALFLLPTVIGFTFNIVSDATSESVGWMSCWDNAENIAYYEAKEKILDATENIAKKINNNTFVISLKKKVMAVVSKKDSGKAGTTPGQSYKLDDDTVYKLAAKAVGEQGNNVEGAAAEASLMANLYELKGSGYSSVYDYVVNGKWFGNSSDVKSAMSSNKPSAEVVAAVKDVLVNGNRTLLLYIDEHDCWDCNNKNYCSGGFKGDICSLTTDGSATTSMSNIKNRSSYKKDKTKVNNVYGSNYTFYIFPTSDSDPFGYTDEAYKKIKG